jgi:hypothetical protein
MEVQRPPHSLLPCSMSPGTAAPTFWPPAATRTASCACGGSSPLQPGDGPPPGALLNTWRQEKWSGRTTTTTRAWRCRLVLRIKLGLECGGESWVQSRFPAKACVMSPVAGCFACSRFVGNLKVEDRTGFRQAVASCGFRSSGSNPLFLILPNGPLVDFSDQLCFVSSPGMCILLR